MKDFLKKLIERKRQELKAKEEKMKASQDIEEVRSLGDTLIALRDEINEAEKQLAELDKEDNKDDDNKDDNGENKDNNNDANADEGRSANGFNPNAILNVVGKAKMNQRSENQNNEDLLSTMEYRQAFKHYAQTGERTAKLNEILTQYRAETREAGEVTSEELGVLIPHTVLQELIKGIEKSYGQLSSRVRMLNVKGGVEIPTGEFEATFTWGGKEGSDKEHGVSDEQKVKGITGSVSFSYHIGEIRIAQSLLQSILSVEVFEKELLNALLTAYLKARDIAVLKGTGENQPTGILTDVAAGLQRIPKENIIEFTEEEIADWTAWEKKLFGIIPIGMEGANPEFAMAKQTYVSNLCTIKDTNNQPINKAGFDVSDRQYKFNEYPVLRTEQDLFKAFDLCANGDIFGLFWVPEKAYGINSNLTFGYKRYFDDDKNKWITKGLVILDGKPLDTNYVYVLKKSSVKTIKVSVPSAETSLNLGEKTVQDLCENLNIDEEGNVTGSLKHIDNWTEFSKTDNSGNFIPLYFEKAKGQPKGTIKCELKGTGAKLKKPVAVDEKDGLIVFQVHNKDNTIEITSEGKETKILNLSKVELKTE